VEWRGKVGQVEVVLGHVLFCFIWLLSASTLGPLLVIEGCLIDFVSSQSESKWPPVWRRLRITRACCLAFGFQYIFLSRTLYYFVVSRLD